MGNATRASCSPLVPSWGHPDCHRIPHEGAALTLPATIAQVETLEQ